MGNLYQRANNSSQQNYSSTYQIIQPSSNGIDIKGIPDDQYLCPKCEAIPEILSIHTDNGHLELKCKYHGVIDLTIEEYSEIMKNHIGNYYKSKCYNCHKEQKSKENMFKYCYYCKVIFCDDCVNNFHQNEKDHRNNHLDVCIPVNEKNNKCLEHFNSDIISYCGDCQENVCEKESTTKHRGHEKILFIKMDTDINRYKDIIIRKNKILSQIIRFNQVILNTYEKFSNNYFHIQSLINVGKSMEEEDKRDSNEIECMMNEVEKLHKIQKEAIKSLNKYKLDFAGNEPKVFLRKREKGDEIFELISKIRFIKLIDLNISECHIKNIDCLKNMNLPFLEFLNLSINDIEKIDSIAELNAKKLKEICLQNNKINNEGIKILLKFDFPALERIRIEENLFDQSLKEFKNILNKYNNNKKAKIYYKVKNDKEFADKYKYKRRINIDKDNDKRADKDEDKRINFDKDTYIDLSHLKGKDELIEDLYLKIKPDNKIKQLKLDDNLIKDVSLLSRIPLKNLVLLDLSLNEITNVKFLTQMKLPKLTTIYLDANKINDIYPLILLNEENKEGKKPCPNLRIISLKENNLKIEDQQSKKVLETLSNKGIELDIDIKDN